MFGKLSLSAIPFHNPIIMTAVGGEYLVEVSWWQIALRTAPSKGLLRAHKDGIGEPPQQHDQGQDNIHDADFLVVEAGEPFFPKVCPLAVVGNQGQNYHG